MAKIEELIPFILYFEAGVSKDYVKLPLVELFERAKKTGFAHDPDDTGGATMCGVTLATYTAYRRAQGYQTTTVKDLKRISFIAWRAILKSMFWDKWKADSIECQQLANMLVDWVWASGKHGITNPQRILGVAQDGIVGNITLSALASKDPKALFNQIKQARLAFVDGIVNRKPSQKKFIRGWKRRINAITWEGLRYD